MGIKVDRKGKRSISRKTQLAKLIEAEGEVSGKGRKIQITSYFSSYQGNTHLINHEQYRSIKFYLFKTEQNCF